MEHVARMEEVRVEECRRNLESYELRLILNNIWNIRLTYRYTLDLRLCDSRKTQSESGSEHFNEL
jgi:hypothetical protein